MSDESDPLLKKNDSPTSSICGTPVRVRALTCLTSLAEGYDMSCIAGAAVIFTKEMGLANHELGLIMGIAHVAMAVGSLLAGSLQDNLGRKPALAIAYALLASGSILMAFAHAFLQLLTGRLLVGLGIGVGLCVISTYMAEVAPAAQRGLYSSLEEMFIVVGVMSGYLASYYLHGIEHDWRWMLGLGAGAPLIFICLLFTPFFPESPRYYVLMGRVDEAKDILSTLVPQEEVQSTLMQWQKALHVTPLSWSQVLCPQTVARRRALLAGVGVCISQLLSGIPIISIYITYVLESELTTKAAFFHVVCLGCFRLVVVSISTFLCIDRLGRRPLLLMGVAGVVVAHMYISWAYYVQMGVVPWKLVGFYLFSGFYGLGIGCVAFTYIGECFDNEVRSKGVSFSLFSSRLVAGFMLLLFPIVADATNGVAYCFAGLAIINVAVLMFVYSMVPETKSLSLESIHNVFASP